MLDADSMLGIQKTDRTGMKEVKVKLPVEQLLKLHYLKLTGGKTFSHVIKTALDDYFAELQGAFDGENPE